MHGCQQLAQPARGAPPARGNSLRGLLDLSHQSPGDAGVNRLLGIEKTINIGRAHMYGLGDVGHRRLLVADFAKQAFGNDENPPPNVCFDVFTYVTHLKSQPFLLTRRQPQVQSRQPFACVQTGLTARPRRRRARPAAYDTTTHTDWAETATSKTLLRTGHP